MRYLVFFEQGDTNYSAYVPDLPVCVAVGDTLEETRKEISEAIQFHIECLQEDEEVVPKSTSKLPNQMPSGVSAEFVNVEVKSKKQFIIPPSIILNVEKSAQLLKNLQTAKRLELNLVMPTGKCISIYFPSISIGVAPTQTNKSKSQASTARESFQP